MPGDVLLEDLRQTGRDDARYMALLSAVQTGGHVCQRTSRRFGTICGYRTASSYMACESCRQRALVSDVLGRLHAAHLGSERTLRLARQTVFWPGLPSDVRNLTSSCRQCAEMRPSQPKETLKA